MKFGIIIETKEPEKVWNAFRFSSAAIQKKHTVKVFLMGEAVECEDISDSQYDVQSEMTKFENSGGELLACGTCLRSRQLDGKTACPISTMFDCIDMIEWADRTITF